VRRDVTSRRKQPPNTSPAAPIAVPSITIAMRLVDREGEPIVLMALGGVEYVMVGVNTNPAIYNAIKQLERELGISAIPGMAFDVVASRTQSMLVLDPNAMMNGLYVRLEDRHKIPPFT